tara:strand:+ start:1293 stop:1511 length:219 start_codon:yes stop_codon:yes gene_type:complete
MFLRQFLKTIEWFVLARLLRGIAVRRGLVAHGHGSIALLWGIARITFLTYILHKKPTKPKHFTYKPNTFAYF